MSNFNKPLGTIDDFVSSVKIKHPTKGPIPFQTFGFQNDVLKAVNDATTPIVLINTARQMGMTTLMCVYALYEAISKPDQVIIILATKYRNALEFLECMKYMIETTTTSIPKITEYNKSTLSFDNGSRIIAKSASQNSLKGISANTILIQDAAFISYSHEDELWWSLTPLLSYGGKIILYSTMHYNRGLFYKLWVENKISATKIKVTWDMHPDRDQNWANNVIQNIGMENFKSEYECEAKIFSDPRLPPI